MAKSSLGCLCGSVPAREESAEKRACTVFAFVFLALSCCGAAGTTCCEMSLLSSILHKIFLEVNMQRLFLLRRSGGCLWPFVFVNLEF